MNGSTADQTNYMLDGGNNIDEYTNVNSPFPFPDALREFSIETANYNAEYGQNAGGIVNIVTKSGTHAFHGDLFEYLRNRVFNAGNYFSNTVDPLKRNQFGGTLGGPVIIPHLVSARHTFFFFGYQKTIVRNQAGGKSSFVPTQANSLDDARRDDCGNYSKMAPPTLANGKVYLASFGTKNVDSGQFCVYGLLPNGPPPTRPVALKAEAVKWRIALAWQAPQAARTYDVKKSVAGENSFEVIASGLTTPAFVDAAIRPGVTYLYKVSAVNSNGESTDSQEISAMVPKPAQSHHVMH